MTGFETGKKHGSPTEAAPPWLAAAIGALDAGLSDDRASGFLLGLTDKTRTRPALDDAAWQRILVFFATDCIQLALDIAAPLQSEASQIYWDEALGACNMVLAALRGERDLAAARSAAADVAEMWEVEAVQFHPDKLLAPSDATWALKCAADTAECAADAILIDPTRIIYAIETAVASHGSPINETSKGPLQVLVKRLASSIRTEFAAATGWRAPLSFS
jgi:hypothetical protein